MRIGGCASGGRAPGHASVIPGDVLLQALRYVRGRTVRDGLCDLACVSSSVTKTTNTGCTTIFASLMRPHLGGGGPRGVRPVVRLGSLDGQDGPDPVKICETFKKGNPQDGTLRSGSALVPRVRAGAGAVDGRIVEISAIFDTGSTCCRFQLCHSLETRADPAARTRTVPARLARDLSRGLYPPRPSTR